MINQQERMAMFAFRIYQRVLCRAQNEDNLQNWRTVGLAHAAFKSFAQEAGLDPSVAFFEKIRIEQWRNG